MKKLNPKRVSNFCTVTGKVRGTTRTCSVSFKSKERRMNATSSRSSVGSLEKSRLVQRLRELQKSSPRSPSDSLASSFKKQHVAVFQVLLLIEMQGGEQGLGSPLGAGTASFL